MAKSGLRPRLVEFKTGRILRRNRRAVSTALDRVRREMRREIRKKITRGQSPPPSRPGAHPHKDSGFLSDNFDIIREGHKLFLRTPQYGIYLETGTKNMAARPWIRRNIGTREKQAFWIRRINTEIRREMRET